MSALTAASESATESSPAGVIPPNHHMHIGAYLRELREYYGLDLEATATHLRIQPRYIEALEKGALEILPARAYGRGYTMKYAEFLGLDPEKTVASYPGLSSNVNADDIVKPASPALDAIHTPEKEEQPTPKWISLALIAGALIVAVTLFMQGETESPTSSPLTQQAEPLRAPLLLSSKKAPVQVRPASHDCMRPTASNALPCWQSGVQSPTHAFAPRAPQQSLFTHLVRR